MLALDNQPHLSELRSLIDKVPTYPITAGGLVKLAISEGSAKEIVDFYRAFPPDEIFNDKDDLLARTEAVEILHHQEAPAEKLRAPEED